MRASLEVLGGIALTAVIATGCAAVKVLAANHERKRLDAMDEQEQQLFTDAHGVLGKLSIAIDWANTTIAGLQPVEDKTAQAIDTLHATTSDLDVFLRSPDLIGTIEHLNGTTGNLERTTADFQARFHDVLYPPKCLLLQEGVADH